MYFWAITGYFGVKRGFLPVAVDGGNLGAVGEVPGGQVTPASFLHGVPVREGSHEGYDGLFLFLGEAEVAKFLPVDVG